MWTEQGAEARAVRRPDHRWLLQLPAGRPEVWVALIGRAGRDVTEPLLVTSYDTAPVTRDLLSTTGFVATRTETIWRISVASLTGPSIEATWHRLIPVDRCDLSRVVDLDNSVRADIPGTRAWEGSLVDLMETMADDEFDPDVYLIAEHTTTGGYDGLIRVWNRTPYPRIGCLGVRSAWRRTRLPVALMSAVAAELVRRGVTEVITETDTLNLGSHEMAARRGTATGEMTEWERPGPA